MVLHSRHLLPLDKLSLPLTILHDNLAKQDAQRSQYALPYTTVRISCHASSLRAGNIFVQEKVLTCIITMTK